ncbi:hypothetical protein [Streptomyces sp. NPDC005507]|uniref:hypothetical protein n=1 Tax=Streptomyces sp. NPDC005507 TaxID=3154885 RepID=UPI0033A00C80
MSLTSALKNPNSPMSRFLAAQLPTPDGVLDALRAQLPPRSATIAPQGAQRFNYRSLGRAIDRRLRVAFGAPVDAPLTAGVGFAPGEVAAASSRAEGRAVREAGQDLLAALTEQPAAHDGVMQAEAQAEERLARLCYAASHFEEVYRAGLFPGNPLLDLAAGDGLQELLNRVPDYVPDDLARQVALAQAANALGWVAQLPAQERLCAPVFAGSRDVGGADADFIAAGMLIDCKATIRPERIDGSAVRQLAGYLCSTIQTSTAWSSSACICPDKAGSSAGPSQSSCSCAVHTCPCPTFGPPASRPSALRCHPILPRGQ